ncbi:MAG: DUF2726 domain-containing protein [Patescibacteria group bacterium]|nr:DUF2726 domain-containing protein [Patescibacteria group bacterium]
MFDLGAALHPFIGLYVLLAVLLVVVAAALIWRWLSSGGERPLAYDRKQDLFDAKTERELFNTLRELYVDRFYIFPQVHYSHLLVPHRGLSYKDQFVLRNKIDRKSADFVLCDKERVQAQLVIELDGSSHERPDRQARDAFIDYISESSDLPLCHIKTSEMGRDAVKAKIDAKLAPKPTDSSNS